MVYGEAPVLSSKMLWSSSSLWKVILFTLLLIVFFCTEKLMVQREVCNLVVYWDGEKKKGFPFSFEYGTICTIIL